ncbi:type II toxin-antitoxin system VapC family toxin [Brucepastera parasyntrophica]|uniref:type II toxin-antitoxin system VapC family toxin n=1 Tax=Brucepastera parasyntrophica TaxID=2880008 RepID=UPI00210F09D3|nr:type II toxin-antitoxin system VapC family toxin [Brucepastera parasyntrophica]ULQ58667.1 type II toxin-antitoxin system VapC family toxin [Brucepastera parasyntrophica]
MIIFDTDVCLSLLGGNKKAIQLYADSAEQICVSSVTVQELFYAANISDAAADNRVLAEQFLLTVRILHPDVRVLKYAADLQARLKKKRIRANYTDILLYSLSRVYAATLVTTKKSRYCFT